MPYMVHKKLDAIILEYGNKGNDPTVLSRRMERMVGIGAKKTTIEAIGARLPQSFTHNGTTSANDEDDMVWRGGEEEE